MYIHLFRFDTIELAEKVIVDTKIESSILSFEFDQKSNNFRKESISSSLINSVCCLWLFPAWLIDQQIDSIIQIGEQLILLDEIWVDNNTCENTLNALTKILDSKITIKTLIVK